MGATVTTGKLVKGFIINAKTYYVLFEETYEKNVHPHHPRWSCFAIGSYQDVMLRLYQYATAAYDGGLQNRPNNLTPEAYLRSWDEAFTKPQTFDNEQISIRILERDLWRNGIESTDAGAVYNKLLSIGRLDVWDKLISSEDTITLNLYDDPDLVVALFGVHGVCSPWRIIHEYGLRLYREVDERLIPSVTRQTKREAVIQPSLEVIKIQGNASGYYDYAVKNQFGYYDGLDDCLVKKVILEDAYQNEMRHHGNGIKCISQFIAKLKNLPVMSGEEFDFYLDLSKVKSSKYLIRNFEELTGLTLESCMENIAKAYDAAANSLSLPTPNIPYVMKLDCQNMTDVYKKHYLFRGCILLSRKQSSLQDDLIKPAQQSLLLVE